ncbi:MAG TPA: SagB/ThcOx family dehydrogenase [Gaiellaceae bacterium]|nr:SagB/ThcOx family dehydrogenase [Gaiellaceae bacterium]
MEEALAHRRSVRSFGRAHLARMELSQLLWAAQGITSGWGARTAPSAGALYPLDVYVATAESYGHYLPDGHRLLARAEEDLRPALAAAAFRQDVVAEAPAVFAVTAVYERSAAKYGARAERYAKLEAGHVAQNILLEAVALGLGAVAVGAFDDEAVQQALRLPSDHAPLYLVAVGAPSGELR